MNQNAVCKNKKFKKKFVFYKFKLRSDRKVYVEKYTFTQMYKDKIETKVLVD